MACVFSCSGSCYNKIIDCVDYTQQMFISHSSGGWEARTGELVDSVFGSCLLPRWQSFRCNLTWWKEGTREFCQATFIRTLLPFMRVPLSCSKHLSMASNPSTITLDIRFQHMNFGGTQTFSP